MAYPTITPLPDAPSRSQDPDAFATTADTFVAALPDLVTEVNAAGDYIDQKTVVVGNDFQGTYAAGTTYTTGQSVLYSGSYYVSLVDANTGNTPDSSPSEWSEIFGEALPSQTGNDGLFLTTDGSTLSWGAAGGGGSLEFVASGAISNGDLVGLNADGTVSVLGGQPLGSATTVKAGTIDYVSATFDSNSNKVVVIYRDSIAGGYGTARVGTVSGTSISFGTPVVFESSEITYISSTFDSNSNKVVISYTNSTNSFYGTAIVGDVSGTSISFGSAVTFASASVSYTSATFDSNSNKVVISYRDNSDTDDGKSVVGTVSGTSISFGSATTFSTGYAGFISSTFDSNSNKVVISYRDEDNSFYATAVVGDVSGTSISFGTPVVVDNSGTNYTSATFDSNSNKVVILHESGGDGKATVGTVSGTSISFGTPVTFDTADAQYISSTFDPVSNQVVVLYGNNPENLSKFLTASVSGTSISFGFPIEFNSGGDYLESSAIVYDTSNNIAIGAYRSNPGDDCLVRLFDSGSNFYNWIGIAEADVADTATGTFTVIGGVNEGQTGLSIGVKYYIQDDGTIDTPAQTNREVGRAIAADKIFVTQGSIS